MSFFRRLLQIITWPLRALLSSKAGFSAAGRWLLNISLPARVAMMMVLFLVIAVVTAFVFFYATEGRARWDYWTSPIRILIITVLVIVIPIVVYRVLKLWLEGDVSRYPDIDYAWQAGMAELERHGLDVSEVPIFLIVGSSGEAQEKALFDASGISFRFREAPQGPAALHWYANPDGIYLVSTETSCLGKLAALARDAEAAERAGPVPVAAEPPGMGVRGTILAGGQSEVAPPTSASEPPPVASRGTGQGAGDIRGTMVVGGMAEGDEPVLTPEKKPVSLSPGDRSEQQHRLEYLCRLIRRARRPLCPVNGILTLLPFGLIQRPREAIEVERCVHSDLATLRRVLMVRCPVTAMVIGMEEEAGFRELVRRVGTDRAAAQRFGKGFSLWNPPTPERLGAVAVHACGSFEDWVYTLFREKESLSKPGNTKLYTLLCKIRLNVQNRLGKILAGGYGAEPNEDPKTEPLLFGGCYFAAAGPTPDRQAFVKGVFDKLPQQQEELDWAPEALREDDGYQQLAQLGLALDTLLMVALAAMIVYRWFPFWR